MRPVFVLELRRGLRFATKLFVESAFAKASVFAKATTYKTADKYTDFADF